MAVEARLVRGNPHCVPYTAGGNLGAGEVISYGGLAAVVHPTAIASGETGTIAIHGGDWALPKDDTTGPEIDAGEFISWIVGSNLATDVTTANLPFGQCTEGAADDEGTVVAFLDPARVSANDDT